MTPAPTPPRPIDCETAVRRLWDYLDHELTAERYAEVAAHLAGCANCPEHFAFGEQFLSTVGSAMANATQTATSDHDLRTQVVERLHAEGFRAA